MTEEKLNRYKALAAQGDAEAQFQLGEYYFAQRSKAETEEDEDKVSAECIKWYTKAAEQGHATAHAGFPCPCSPCRGRPYYTCS